MTDTSKQLLPCPFCGGAPEIGSAPRRPADISCENYDCPMIVETDVGAFGDAVKIWNTRASTPCQLNAEVIARVQFPPTTCVAWEDCNHDGVCHDAEHCGFIST